MEGPRVSLSRHARAVALAGFIVLIACGPEASPDRCVPSCTDSMSCVDSCHSRSCPCPENDVCDRSGACVPCVVGSCQLSAACMDQCGNADNSCATFCEHPDTCIDNCGIADTAVCAGAECDPHNPGNCHDTCGHYASKCCCVPTICANVAGCVDDCGNFDPSECKGRVCGPSCQDTCGEPDNSCWSLCAEPTNCQDNCGNYNSTACSGEVCDPNLSGFDTCGKPDDGC